MPLSRYILILAAVFDLASATLSQQPRPSAAKQGPITIDALVLDTHGSPVPGLDVHDFTLMDNGQPQQLSGFKAVAGPSRVVIVLDMINTGFGEVDWEREQLNEFFAENGGTLRCPVTLAAMTNVGL